MNEITLTINGVSVSVPEGETILHAAVKAGIEIPTLCHHESVKPYGACGLCVVEADGIPKLLRACATKAADGMVIHTETERVIRARKIALELLLSDHTGDCRPPCTLKCPAGTDCRGYIGLIAEGKYHEAAALVKEKFPFPASIGRVCPHPCEKACRRANVEEPLSIAFLKYFAGDMDLKENPYMPEKKPSTGKRVAIIGGGPAGLTAAYFLTIGGHEVTVFDQSPKMGGMLRYGIPEYRLPKAVLDAEIALIEKLGVHFRNQTKIGRDITLDALRSEYDAVLVAVGAWTSSKMGVPGEELNKVYGGIDFLHTVAEGAPSPIGDRVVVVGGGNTAMDACRTAVRCGASQVTVVYRRTRAEMPAEDIEIDEAMEEGVEFRFLTTPVEFLSDNGTVNAVRLQQMELGEPDASGRRRPVPIDGAFETLPVDSVIMAIGQHVDVTGLEQLSCNRRGILEADESTFLTSCDGVFAVGDATNRGASIAIEAIGEANKAAAVIDSYLAGAMVPYRKPYYSEDTVDPNAPMFREKEKRARAQMPVRPAAERKASFAPVTLGFAEETARKEAERCLKCGCHDFGECRLIRYANLYDVHPERFAGEKNHHPTEQKLVVIERNPDKCVLCGLCVRICDNVAKQGILGLVGRGFSTVIKPEFDRPEVVAVCADCKKCEAACPTGALRVLD